MDVSSQTERRLNFVVAVVCALALLISATLHVEHLGGLGMHDGRSLHSPRTVRNSGAPCLTCLTLQSATVAVTPGWSAPAPVSARASIARHAQDVPRLELFSLYVRPPPQA